MDLSKVELPTACVCGDCGRCRNADLLGARLGRAWYEWNEDQVRGALGVLSLDHAVAGLPAPTRDVFGFGTTELEEP